MHAEIAIMAGSTSQENEDWAGTTPAAVVVLDGLTAPPDLDSGCTHGVPWYVNHLGSALLARMAEGTTGLKSCLASAITDVAARHRGTCDLANPGTPQSTVALVRARDSELEWLVLADSVVVLDLGAELRVISDDRVGGSRSGNRQLNRALHLVVIWKFASEVTRSTGASSKINKNADGYLTQRRYV